MNIKFRNIALAMMLAVMTPCVTSCVSDDDEESNGLVGDVKQLIVGQWEDDLSGEMFIYQSSGFGVYWDPSESNQQQAESGSGKFKWEVQGTDKVYRYFYMETTNAYGDPDPEASPMTVLSISTKKMQARTTDNETKTFTKVTQ